METRTGFITTLTFLKENNARMKIKSFNKADHIIRNIRKFEISELSIWLKTGDINEAKIK